MQKFQFQPITAAFSQKIRTSATDGFGHRIEKNIATEKGYGPCRSCLRQFLPGESRLLFSIAPVGSENPYNEIGPVFIHADGCKIYSETAVFPPEIKAGRLPIKLVLRAYSSERRMIGAVQVAENQQVEKDLEKMFNNPDVDFVHVRNGEVQCFICAVRRG